jgi:pyrimidine operon attenuation protein/uracil phosphoribosyltransferase
MVANMILSKASAEKKLRRMAMEILEQHHSSSELLLVGIRQNGWPIARKIQAFLKEDFTGNLQVAVLTIDKKSPSGIQLEPAVSCSGKTVILVDDVANSGRTILYALKPLLDAYPEKIQTLALVARTHRSFPVALDFVGMSVSTSPEEYISVDVHDDAVAGAYIQSRQ